MLASIPARPVPFKLWHPPSLSGWAAAGLSDYSERGMLGLGRPGLPTMKRPRGMMTPRSPGFLLLLLVLTLAAMWLWWR